MNLISYKEEIKRHNSSVTVLFSVESIQSFLDDAIIKQIIPGISRAELDDFISWKATYPLLDETASYALNAKVLFISSVGAVDFYKATANASIGETPETHPNKWTADLSDRRTGFLLIQKSAVNFAIAFYTAFGSLQLSDSGAHVVQSGENRIASDKKLIQLKRQSMSDGFSALETAIEFLESKLNVFTSYAESISHTRNRNGFINSSEQFNAIGAIQIDAQLFSALKNIQTEIIDDQIKAILGEELLETLLDKIKAGNPTSDESKLIGRVQKALAPLTMAEAIPYKMISFDSSGIYQLSDTVGGISGNVENKRPAEDKTAQAAMVSFCSKGESELESLRKWLIANAELFDDFQSGGTRSDQNPNTGSGGIYMM